jgi:uncharacterized phiE125 gp8 family phage protein
MAIKLTSKAPGERVDYIWSPPLDEGDTITGAATVALVSGTAVNESATVEAGSLTVKLWFTLGADSETSIFSAEIDTVGGRTWQETFYLPVNDTDKYQLSLALVKQHLEYEDDDRDELISQYMRAAEKHVEKYTGKALLRQEVVETLDCFGSYIQLLREPVISVTTIAYVDADDAAQTVTGYRLRAPRIYPPVAGWPEIADYSPVTVTYQAGYDETPADLISAQLLLIGHWFQNREAATERPAQSIEIAVESLLTNYRNYWA